jgi:hypothetical protein
MNEPNQRERDPLADPARMEMVVTLFRRGLDRAATRKAAARETEPEPLEQGADP